VDKGPLSCCGMRAEDPVGCPMHGQTLSSKGARHQANHRNTHQSASVATEAERSAPRFIVASSLLWAVHIRSYVPRIDMVVATQVIVCTTRILVQVAYGGNPHRCAPVTRRQRAALRQPHQAREYQQVLGAAEEQA
jgi:hypothetical protein